jgi:hypothetical protein
MTFITLSGHPDIWRFRAILCPKLNMLKSLCQGASPPNYSLSFGGLAPAIPLRHFSPLSTSLHVFAYPKGGEGQKDRN